MNRRRLSMRDKLEILVRQATCPMCGEKLGALEGLDLDHEQALARGGTDTNDNLRFLHRDCHKVKTFGSGGTTNGSDIHEAAKTKRLEKDAEDFRRKILSRECGEKRQPSGKIPSRGFQRKTKLKP